VECQYAADAAAAAAATERREFHFVVVAKLTFSNRQSAILELSGSDSATPLIAVAAACI